MQTQPLSRRTVDEIEDILDLLHEMCPDGETCHINPAQMRKEIEEAYEIAIATDEAQALSVAMMRNGPTSPRVRKLTRLYVVEHHPDPEAA